MVNREQKSNLDDVVAFNIQAIGNNNLVEGIEVDTQGYDSILIIPFAGTITDGTFTPVVTSSTTSGSGFSEVADSDLTNTEADTALDTSNTSKTLGYIGSERFLKVNIQPSGVTSGGTIGILIIRANSANLPVDAN